ncbi:MAG: hypothetical protein K9G33_12885 [Sneathiella sp.]|nr:hypothetical protein [Sneathiella sp.]
MSSVISYPGAPDQHLHRGGANLSTHLRPLLYLTYHRSWFRDFGGYEDRPPVNVSNRELRKIPDAYKHMFTWTTDPYVFIRYKTVLRSLIPGKIKRLARSMRG